MKQLIFTVLMMAVYWLPVCAQTPDGKVMAGEMNRRAENGMKKLHSLHSVDSLSYSREVIDVVEYSLKCDEYDRMPDKKGNVRLKYRDNNHRRLVKLGKQLLDVGRYFQKNNQRSAAARAFKMYMQMAESPLMKGEEDLSGIAAFQLALMDLDNRNYKSASRFADICLSYDNSALSGAEIKAQCMRAQMITAQDSARYLSVINKLYETDPNNEKYFSWIMRFYDRPQQRYKLEYFVDKQLEENPNTIVPWVLKGEIAMKAGRWDEAIDAYKHADEIDPSSVPIAYNIGVCLNNKAVEMVKTSNSEISSSAVSNLLVDARSYLERVRRRDPHRKKVDWVKPLYMVYSVLGDKIKAEELEPIVNGYKKKFK